MRKLSGFTLLFFLSARTFSQIITVNAGNDTTICLGTSATLNAVVPSFTFHQTTDYLIQNMTFAPEPFTGTNTNMGVDDQCYGTFPIGFTFCFYGNSYTNFYLGTNGWLGFSGAPGTGGPGYDPWVTTTIPNPGTGTPKNCIMGPWKDWWPTVGPTPGQYIRYTTTGTAPNRKLIVTYQNIPMYQCTTTYATFQMVLHETTNIIDNHLVNVTVCPTWNSGNGVQGLHNITGTVAKVVAGRNNTVWTASSESKQFIPNGPIITNSVSWYALPNTTTAIGTGNTITVTPTSPNGVYPYSVTYQAKLVVCTTLTDNVVVTVNPCGYLDGMTDMVDCYGASTGSVTVYIYDGIPPYTYTWSNGVIISNTNDNSSTISNLPAGNYSVTVSMFNGAYTLDTLFTVTQNPQMSLTQLGTTPEACAASNDGTLTVGVTNGTPTYFYSIGNFTSPSNNTSYQFTGLDAGSYMVTVTDIYGCVVIDNYTVDVLPQMTISLTPISATCPGAPDGSIVVHVNNGTPDYTYFCTFSPQQPTTPNTTYTFTGLQGGNYNVNVVDANGCAATGITVVGELQITSSTNVTDVSCYAGHNGAASVQVQGGTQPYTYLWSTGGTGPSVNMLYAGYYACTVTDAHNCIIVVPITIDQPDSIVITSSVDTTMCLTEIATISANATGGTPPYIFIWSNGQSGQSIQVSPANTTTYYAHAVDANGCTSITSDVTVNIFPPVTIYPYTYIDSLCAGDSTAIYANFAGGNGGPYNCFLNDSMITFPYYAHPQVTTTITLTGKDTCGSPSGTGSVIIYILNAPGSNVQAIPTSGCAPVTVTFIDPSPYEGQLYLWDFEDLGEHGYSVAPKPEYTYDHPGVYDVILTTKSTFGCYSTVIYNDFITIRPSPVADFVPEPQATSILNPVIFFHNYTADYLSNTWIFGDGNSSTMPEVQHTYQDTGTFPVQLIVQNSEGCADTMISYIEISPENTFWVPTAFNPHSTTGENTNFIPAGTGIDPENFHMIVYNRWGGKAFETFDVNHGWNGKLKNGEFAKSGTYTWVVIYKDLSGKTKQKTGSVTLIE